MRVKKYKEWLRVVPSKPGVYFLMRYGHIIYIGSAMNIRTRVKHHNYEGKFDELRWIVMGGHLRAPLEREMVLKHRPPLNRNTPTGYGHIGEGKRMVYAPVGMTEESLEVPAFEYDHSPFIMDGATA